MVGAVGFEPTISALKGPHPRPLDDAPTFPLPQFLLSWFRRGLRDPDHEAGFEFPSGRIPCSASLPRPALGEPHESPTPEPSPTGAGRRPSLGTSACDSSSGVQAGGPRRAPAWRAHRVAGCRWLASYCDCCLDPKRASSRRDGWVGRARTDGPFHVTEVLYRRATTQLAEGRRIERLRV